jgi:hypothetical protein
LSLLAGITRASDGRWDFELALDAAKLQSRFPKDVTYAVVPIGEVFAHVYRECKKIQDTAKA